ncbi:hypothetical protein V8E36_006300 [Tilletia maclaganii]
MVAADLSLLLRLDGKRFDPLDGANRLQRDFLHRRLPAIPGRTQLPCRRVSISFSAASRCMTVTSQLNWRPFLSLPVMFCSYPDYQASVLAGNDTMRSLIGGAFPIFATAMFKNLQKKGPANFPVSWGCTLLGCISIVMIPLPFILYKYGKQIRSHSKFATHD